MIIKHIKARIMATFLFILYVSFIFDCFGWSVTSFWGGSLEGWGGGWNESMEKCIRHGRLTTTQTADSPAPIWHTNIKIYFQPQNFKSKSSPFGWPPPATVRGNCVGWKHIFRLPSTTDPPLSLVFVRKQPNPCKGWTCDLENHVRAYEKRNFAIWEPGILASD